MPDSGTRGPKDPAFGSVLHNPYVNPRGLVSVVDRPLETDRDIANTLGIECLRFTRRAECRIGSMLGFASANSLYRVFCWRYAVLVEMESRRSTHLQISSCSLTRARHIVRVFEPCACPLTAYMSNLP